MQGPLYTHLYIRTSNALAFMFFRLSKYLVASTERIALHVCS